MVCPAGAEDAEQADLSAIDSFAPPGAKRGEADLGFHGFRFRRLRRRALHPWLHSFAPSGRRRRMKSLSTVLRFRRPRRRALHPWLHSAAPHGAEDHVAPFGRGQCGTAALGCALPESGSSRAGAQPRAAVPHRSSCMGRSSYRHSTRSRGRAAASHQKITRPFGRFT